MIVFSENQARYKDRKMESIQCYGSFTLLSWKLSSVNTLCVEC
uniref:Uncharacterized protein n=1 Tax=Anguilla anguilla TaxID=7936 RepID=A0A0E9PGE2_ANGAN